MVPVRVRSFAMACLLALAACGGVPRRATSATSTTTATSGSATTHAPIRAVCEHAPFVEVTFLSGEALPPPVAPTVKARGDSIPAELLTLERKAAWQDLLERADEVSAAQRGPGFEKIVERAATALLRDDEAIASFDDIFRSQRFVERYSSLATSKSFAAERARAIGVATEACLADPHRGRRCVDGIKEWLRTPGTPPEVALAIAKRVRASQNAYVAAPLFRWVLEHARANAALCADDDLRVATATALALPDEYDEAAAARAIVAGPCWDTMKDGLRTTLETANGSYFRDNACAVMKAKGAL